MRARRRRGPGRARQRARDPQRRARRADRDELRRGPRGRRPGADQADPRASATRSSCGRLAADDERNPLKPLLADAAGPGPRERREDQDSRDEKLEQKLDELIGKAAELAGLDQGREALEEAEEAGTRKGRSFEERVDARSSASPPPAATPRRTPAARAPRAAARRATRWSSSAPPTGPPAGRIVFEAKDKKLSKNDAWRELNEAMAARAASFGVLVVAGEDRVPSGRETLTEYEGNKLIVARRPRGARWARAGGRLPARRRARGDGPRPRSDGGRAGRSRRRRGGVSCLKQAQAIRASLTGIKTSSDKARGDARRDGRGRRGAASSGSSPGSMRRAE